MSRFRLILTAALAAAMCLAIAGSALAAPPTVVRNSGSTVASRRRQQRLRDDRPARQRPGDRHRLRSRLGWCTNRKLSVMVTTTIKATSPNGTVYSYSSLPTPLSTRCRSTDLQNGCYKWQTVVERPDQ